MNFKDYLYISEIADNYGLTPTGPNLEALYKNYKQPVGGAENSEKPPTPADRRKKTKKELLATPQ
jgi:hypothetical protein